MSKCLIIYGSPRVNGNTDKILMQMKQLFNEKDIVCNEVFLRNLKIKPCLGCDFCTKNQRCILNDDFTNLIDKVINCDIIVIGTPVYFGGVTSWLKLFVDRLQLFYNNSSLIGNKKTMYFVSVAAERNPKVFEPLLLSLRYISYALHISSYKKILINGYYDIRDIDELLKDYDIESIIVDDLRGDNKDVFVFK